MQLKRVTTYYNTMSMRMHAVTSTSYIIYDYEIGRKGRATSLIFEYRIKQDISQNIIYLDIFDCI